MNDRLRNSVERGLGGVELCLLVVGLALLLGVSACSQPELQLESEELSWGEVVVGATAFADLQLELTAGGPAEISVQITPDGGVFFVRSLPDPVLGSGDAGLIRLGFNPGELSLYSARLKVTASHVEGESTQEVTLMGRGVVGPLDLDRDGFLAADDCDDDDPSVHPLAAELCDGVDSNCDGELGVDETDEDQDGWLVCAGDCVDGDETIFPGAPELCDGLDNDCDGLFNESDVDEDGYRDCDGDCDDGESSIFPGAPELCDGLDSDCDGALSSDELDLDEDGYWPCAGDCEDSAANIYPGASELCDGLDNDCDPTTEAVGGEADVDLDGFRLCEDDCDDGAGSVFPGAPEVCDGVDTDCDPTTTPAGGEDDGDSDGVFSCEDCDDGESGTYPGAPEQCDGEDNDCDLVVPDDELDGDGDGVVECAGDCDDGDPTIFTGAPEECFDMVDNDCDGLVNGSCPCPIWAWNQPSPSCTSNGTFDCPFDTIAGALVEEGATSACGDIWLRPGTYTETVVLDGTRSLHGGGAIDEVVFDGQFVDRPILVEEYASVTISSLTVQNGYAVAGGGLSALEGSLVNISEVAFENNQCHSDGLGGALHFEGADFSVVDSIFEANDCGFGQQDQGNDGGGIAAVSSQGTVEGNLFVGNSAGDGSDLYVRNSISSVLIVGNSFFDGMTGDFNNPMSGEWRGGAVIVASNHVLVNNNLFAGHQAAEGATGVFVAWGSTLTQVLNNLFVFGSTADGGAIHFGPTTEFDPPSVVANNTVLSNTGWGFYSDYWGWPAGVSHNAVFDNSDGTYSAANLTTPNPLFSVETDPLLVALSNDGDWSNDDFSLAPASPCIDEGRYSPSWLDPDGSTADIGLYGGPYGNVVVPLP
jgi:hypothetical protein